MPHNHIGIQIDTTFVESIKVHSIASDEYEKMRNIDLGYGAGYTDNDDTKFSIVFDMTIKLENKYKILKVQYISNFATDKPLTKEFKKSDFININAPAIAYPFFRAYISQFLLLSGYNPIMLPTINFVALHQDNQNEKSHKTK